MQSTTTTNRRRLLGTLALAPLAALPVAAHAAEASGDDAELTALSARFVILEQRIGALYKTHTALEQEAALEAAIAPLADEQDTLAERMRTISVSGIAGIQAKARALVAWSPDLVSEPHLTLGTGIFPDLLASILDDLTGPERLTMFDPTNPAPVPHLATAAPRADADALDAYRRVLAATALMEANTKDDGCFTDALLQQHAAMLDLADAHATTLAGLKVKAEAIRMAFEVTFCAGHHPSIATIEEDAEWHVQLAWSLARDVLAMGGAGV